MTVRAVLEQCATKDPATVTTQMIAEQMGLTQGALFRHFPNKAAIWEAVATWMAGQLAMRWDDAAKGPDTNLDKLESMFIAHSKFISENPGVPRMMLGELQNPETTGAKTIVRTMMKGFSARLKTLFEAGISNGEIRNDLAVGSALILYNGALQGLVVQSLQSGDFSRNTQKSIQIFAIFRQGIETRT